MQLFLAFQKPSKDGNVSVREVMANSRRHAALRAETPINRVQLSTRRH